jgi:hypothetical protein
MEDRGWRIEDGFEVIALKLKTNNPMPTHPASSIQYPASSIQHPASSIQYPASSIYKPIPND